jgi:hypothetical protein
VRAAGKLKNKQLIKEFIQDMEEEGEGVEGYEKKLLNSIVDYSGLIHQTKRMN